ncbi:MAG: tRNA guanosine(34) transglycosylase Tgt [Deltaproteobacteria bacterium]|jgi:queuine tRNA-ribosyltransferase|nr:tRNA guanosine(34) transglycosylase Tgt [Deltaproteobacteria bacterium]
MEDIFTIHHRDTKSYARCGELKTAHGTFPTPMFMPVGTRAAVKALDPDDLKALGAKIVLSNTYHLMCRPGEDLISQMGGLHKFMGWDGPILTDSGGFQVFSLKNLRRIEEDSVIFQSPYDGSKYTFTPLRALKVQEKLGSDIMMCLDEPLGYPAGEKESQAAMDRTLRWAEMTIKHWDQKGDKLLFGISQGGFYPQLREKSAQDIASLGFAGNAAGGLALGEPQDLRISAIQASLASFPLEKPRYLMGLGTPLDLLDGIRLGADLFDCVLPTRNGRNGQFFTKHGKINIANSRYRSDPLPIDENCKCRCCQNFSRSYLRHLYSNREPLFPRLASIHNLYFYLELMEGARLALREGNYMCYHKEFYNAYQNGPQDEAF